MTIHQGDVVLFRHDPNEPVTYDRSKHTGLVLDAWDELGDDQNEPFALVLWSTAGTIGEIGRHHPKYLKVVKTNLKEAD